MPDNVVKGLADKTGKSIDTVENAWESSTKDYVKQNNTSKEKLSSKDWATIVTITKRKLGMKEEKSLFQKFVESNKTAKEFLESVASNIQAENPGVLEVPEGKKVSDMGQDHFEALIKSKGWNEISKALMNLVRWNKNDDKALSDWADSMQSKLSDWVDKQRETNKNFGE